MKPKPSDILAPPNPEIMEAALLQLSNFLKSESRDLNRAQQEWKRKKPGSRRPTTYDLLDRMKTALEVYNIAIKHTMYYENEMARYKTNCKHLDSK